MISLAHDVDALTSDFTQDPDAQTGAREGMSTDELLVDFQLATKRPDFVLEAVGAL